MKLQRRHGLKVVFFIACACFTSLVVLFNKIHKMSMESSSKATMPVPREETVEGDFHVAVIHAAVYSSNVTGLPSPAVHILVMTERPLPRESFKCNSYTMSSDASTDVT